MANLTSNESFTTKIKGTVGNILTGKKIILYNSRFITEKISISNIDYVINLIKESNYYFEIERKEVSDNYKYNRLDSGNKLVNLGFDTIVYLSLEDLPIGFTEFNRVQGLLSDELIIKVDISQELSNNDITSSEKIELFNNSLSQIIEYSSSIKSLISNKPYGYTSAKRINEDISTRGDIYPKYTNHVSELNKQPKDNILLTNGFCNISGLHKLDLVKEMLVADNFENHQLGYYRGEIVLYLWNNVTEENKNITYSVYSLSRRDKFKNPICYTNTSNNKRIIQNPEKGEIVNTKTETSRSKTFTGVDRDGNIVTYTGQVKTTTTTKEKKSYEKILYASSKFLLISVKVETTKNSLQYGKKPNGQWTNSEDIITISDRIVSKTIKEVNEVFNFEQLLWVNIENTFIPTMDIWKTSGTIYEIPEILSKKRIVDLFPEVLNLHINIHTYNENIFILKRIGEWFVFEMRDQELFIFTNITKTVYISKKYDIDAIPINNDILLLKTESKDKTILNYFTESGIFYSENAIKSIFENTYLGNNEVQLVESEYNNLTTYTIQSQTEIIPEYLDNKINYEEKKIIVETVGDNLINSYTLGFKRNIMNKITIPNIIGSLNGLVYEKEGNLIRYF